MFHALTVILRIKTQLLETEFITFVYERESTRCMNVLGVCG